MPRTDDETIRVPSDSTPMREEDPPSPTPDRSSVHEDAADITPRASPVKPSEPSPVKGPRVIDGVEIDREDVKAAIVSYKEPRGDNELTISRGSVRHRQSL